MASPHTTMFPSTIESITTTENATTAVIAIKAARIFTISVITIVSFLGNLLLLITISLSATFRQQSFNHLIISVAITNLLTCVFTIPMVIGYAFTDKWDFGVAMCNILGHFIFTGAISMCIGIMLMALDRAIAVKNCRNYFNLITVKRTRLFLLSAWLIAIFLPLPLGAGLPVALVKSFPHRYVCGIAPGSDMNYLLALYIIGFITPSLVSIATFFYVGKKALNERDYMSDGNSSMSWLDVKATGFVFVLFLLWVVGEVPYLILTSVEQYQHSRQTNAEFEYPPDLDTVLVWLKFCHSAVLPFATFRWKKDLWTKLKDLVLCRKSNSVKDESPGKDRSLNRQRNTVAAASKARFESRVPVPTLYAKSDGLHVQVEETQDDYFYTDMNMTGKSNLSGLIRQEQHVEDQEDTSDYETDRFSQSDPVSVRSSRSVHSTDANLSKSFRTKANSVSTDSGVSSGQNSYSGKKKKRKGNKPLELTTDQRSEATVVTTIADVNHVPSEGFSVVPEPLYPQAGMRLPVLSVRAEAIPAQADPPQTKRKKKKKRTVDITDAETNTTQQMEMVSMRPPPRLAPLDPQQINQLATPPLRSKMSHNRPPTSRIGPNSEPEADAFPHDALTEETNSELPPLPDEDITPRSDKPRKKRKKRRASGSTSGGESDRQLRNSGDSTHLRSTFNPELERVEM